jgi:hypothetical protein
MLNHLENFIMTSIHEIVTNHLFNGIYIYGQSGIGKTSCVLDILKRKNFYINYYEITNIKQDTFFESYSQIDIFNLFNEIEKNKQIICVIDNIDQITNTEKKFISTLNKKFNSKKNKIKIPFILIGTNNHDKYIKEFIKLGSSYEIKENLYTQQIDNTIWKNEQNLHTKVYNILHEYKNTNDIVTPDKTTFSLLLHENIIDSVLKNSKNSIYEHDFFIKYYIYFLNMFCYGDYYDRISFQKQLWMFNDMTYQLKCIANYEKYKELGFIYNKVKSNIRFTKILTKYSNEYSNKIFIINICKKMEINKKELFYFIYKNREDIGLCESKGLSKSEVKRILKIFQLPETKT